MIVKLKRSRASGGGGMPVHMGLVSARDGGVFGGNVYADTTRMPTRKRQRTLVSCTECHRRKQKVRARKFGVLLEWFFPSKLMPQHHALHLTVHNYYSMC